MKHFKSYLFVLALSCISAHAAFLSPTLPARAEAFATAAAAPAALAPNVWTVTNDNDAGPGSLRAAISNAAAGDTIQFALGKRSRAIDLKSTLVIDKSLTILGPGPDKLSVKRNSTNHFRVFDIDAGVVTLAGLTIENGSALNPDGQSDNLGGGILNWATLTVSNCVVTKNDAPNENGGRGFGGGIFSVGTLQLVDSTVSKNDSDGAAGGVAIFHAPFFSFERCTFNDNESEVQAGGIHIQGSAGALVNCTISGNEIDDDGQASGLLAINFSAEQTSVALSSCTVANNEGDDSAVMAASLDTNGYARIALRSTLAAHNDPKNFSLFGSGAIVSAGNNLDSDGSSGFANGVNGDIVGSAASPVNVRLGKLRWNGGPTQTHALLLPNNPAIDTGSCQDIFGATLATDQRGYPRPQGNGCDIGAFENQPAAITCSTRTTFECSDDLSVTVTDPDGGPLTVVWTIDNQNFETNVVSADPGDAKKVKLNGSLSLGTHSVRVTVTDGSGTTAECSTTITLQDTKDPKIKSIKATPKSLSPATNQLVPVTLQVRTEDCGAVQTRIIAVRSNQPSGADPDWIITGDLTVQLRATRTGNRDRTYTITVEATDAAGNTSRDTVTVKVTKDKMKDHDDDDDRDH